MDDAEKEFEILGAARALGARGSVSGSGVSLGLDRGSDETRSGFRKAAVLVRAHWPGGAGGGCGGRTGDARGCLPQGGGLGTRKPESVGPWHTPDPLDCGRRADGVSTLWLFVDVPVVLLVVICVGMDEAKRDQQFPGGDLLCVMARHLDY